MSRLSNLEGHLVFKWNRFYHTLIGLGNRLGEFEPS